MPQKICNGLIAMGALVAFVGLMFFPSALMGANKEDNMLGAGMAIFSMGALGISVGFYFKAKSLSSPEGDAARLAAGSKRRRGSCDACQQDAAVVQCTMHKMALCAACLSKHYDSRACVYVPAIRRSVVRSSRGASVGRG
jgi:hypothetical protein